MAELRRMDETPVVEGTLAEVIGWMMEFSKNVTEILKWLETINEVNCHWDNLFQYQSDWVHHYYFSATFPVLKKEFSDEELETLSIDDEAIYEICISLQKCQIYLVKSIKEKKYDIVRVKLRKSVVCEVYYAVDDNTRDDVEYDISGYVPYIDESDWEDEGWSGDVEVIEQKYEARQLSKWEAGNDYYVVNLDDLSETE